MMDTVLNIGLNEKTLEALAKQSQNERFAWDSYRRFVQMYGDVVLDMKPKDKRDTDPFEEILEEVKHKAKVEYDSELSVDQLKDVVAQFKKMVKEQTGKDFPTDPMEQVWGAIGAVFSSWMNDRAVVYRRHIRHSARVGHSHQRAGDGLWQPGERLRHGRRPHARRGAGTARLQRRLSGQRPGRRRRRRHPHAQADRRSNCPKKCPRPSSSSTISARRWSGTTRTCRTSNSLSSAARSGCCRPATPSGPASPPCGSPSTWSTKG